jgi:hypothetical protein
MYKKACHQNDLKCDSHVVFKDSFQQEYNPIKKKSIQKGNKSFYLQIHICPMLCIIKSVKFNITPPDFFNDTLVN